MEQVEWVHEIKDEAATLKAAHDLAYELFAGDIVTLSGALGVGKTTFARALIRALMEDETLDVPSPTYQLIQIYDAPLARIVHADLYRIESPEELAEIGWEDEAENAIVLCEWPEKIGHFLQQDRIDITIEMGDMPEMRRLIIRGFGRFGARIRRARAIQALFRQLDLFYVKRSRIAGDASGRQYERLYSLADQRSMLLMIAPSRAHGPAIRQGKSYLSLAHIAPDAQAFVAMNSGLRQAGLNVPHIYAMDLANDVLIIEDFGQSGLIVKDQPVLERYELAVEALLHLHAQKLPTNFAFDLSDKAEIANYTIPSYDLDALMIEVELVLEWYYPFRLKKTPNAGTRLGFVSAWNDLCAMLEASEKHWVLRDFHSPNLFFMPHRAGLERLGVIDFQDCVLGHSAYDLVSLLQDARITIPEAFEVQLLTHYIRARRAHDPSFQVEDFTFHYAILGAQRASKILGAFVRLARRDGKAQYLEHLPRVEAYLWRCLQHPGLTRVRAWYEAHLPFNRGG